MKQLMEKPQIILIWKLIQHQPKILKQLDPL